MSSNELVVPDGRQLDLHLTALDVIHSFWVPEWRIKRDLVPSGPGGNDVDNTVAVTPDRRHLQRGLHRVLRLRARDDAGAGPRGARRTSSTAGWDGRSWFEPQPGAPSGSSTGTAPEEASSSAEGT